MAHEVSGTFEGLIHKLRQRGLRITPQREMILSAFSESHTHLTAEQIIDKIHQHSPSVNIATVYRNLEMLREHGILAVTMLPGGPLEWELIDGAPHHHLVCEKCHGVTQIPGNIVQELADHLLEQHGFHANLQHLALSGICRECAEQN